MFLSMTRRILRAQSRRRWPDGPMGLQDDCRSRHGSHALARCATSGLSDCFGLTDIGRARKSNEDQFLIANLTRCVAIRHSMSQDGNKSDGQETSDADLLVVADGVGGNAGGERASRLAVEGAVEYLLQHRWALPCHEQCQREQVLQGLTATLTWAQQRIQRATETSPECARMGTTLTLAYLAWPDAYIAHVGDSRAYVCDGSGLLQLTQDQTVAQMLADAGVIDARRVDGHPYQNVLGSLLSANPTQLIPSVQRIVLTAGDQLLLCTDGLTKHLSCGKIAGILRFADSAEDACRQLVSAANEAGGSDNITVVVARFAGDGEALMTPHKARGRQDPRPQCVYAAAR
jgi:PPM family protein phosphatase